MGRKRELLQRGWTGLQCLWLLTSKLITSTWHTHITLTRKDTRPNSLVYVNNCYPPRFFVLAQITRRYHSACLELVVVKVRYCTDTSSFTVPCEYRMRRTSNACQCRHKNTDTTSDPMRCSPCASASRSVLRFEFCDIIGGVVSNFKLVCVYSSDVSLLGGSILIGTPIREVLSGHFSECTVDGGVERAGV